MNTGAGLLGKNSSVTLHRIEQRHAVASKFVGSSQTATLAFGRSLHKNVVPGANYPETLARFEPYADFSIIKLSNMGRGNGVACSCIGRGPSPTSESNEPKTWTTSSDPFVAYAASLAPAGVVRRPAE